MGERADPGAAASERARALFVTDLDGTLLGPDGEVADRNLGALRRANSSGVAVAIVTGRRQSSVRREYRKLPGIAYRVATSNGSVVLAPDNTTPEAVRSISWSLVDELAADRSVAHAHVLCIAAPEPGEEPPHGLPDCYVLTPRTRDWRASWRPWEAASHEPADADRARVRRLVHVAVHFETREEAEREEHRLRPTMPDEAEIHVVQSPVLAGALLEIVPSGGKGLALRHLAARLGVAPDATGAIGDELNDGALLDAARHRYAVGGSVLARERPDAQGVTDAASGALGEALELFMDELTPSGPA